MQQESGSCKFHTKILSRFYVFEPANRPVNIQTLMEDVDFVVCQCSFANSCISKKVFGQNINVIPGISLANCSIFRSAIYSMFPKHIVVCGAQSVGCMV